MAIGQQHRYWRLYNHSTYILTRIGTTSDNNSISHQLKAHRTLHRAHNFPQALIVLANDTISTIILVAMAECSSQTNYRIKYHMSLHLLLVIFLQPFHQLPFDTCVEKLFHIPAAHPYRWLVGLLWKVGPEALCSFRCHKMPLIKPHLGKGNDFLHECS